MRHMVSRSVTVQYPEQRLSFAPRYRGIHEFELDKCIACDMCAKACPVDCIYIDKSGPRKIDKKIGKVNPSDPKNGQLLRYAIDYSKCLFCALWSPEFEYAEGDITHLTHEMDRLEDWMSTVLPPSPLEEGAKGPELKAAAPAPAASPPAAEAPVARPAPVEAAGAAPVETEPRPAGMSEAEYFEQRAAAGRLVRQKVFEEEIAKGSDPRVAEARAKAAEMRARKATVADAPLAPQAIGASTAFSGVGGTNTAGGAITALTAFEAAIGGAAVTQTVEGRERYTVALRYARELRDEPDALANVLVPTPTGAQIPLSQVARLGLASPPRGLQLGVREIPACGTNDEVLLHHGLDAASIADTIAAALGKRTSRVS